MALKKTNWQGINGFDLGDYFLQPNPDGGYLAFFKNGFNENGENALGTGMVDNISDAEANKMIKEYQSSVVPTTGGSSTAAAAEPAYVPEIRVFNGQQYDINNPDQRAAYVTARQGGARSESDRQLSSLRDAYRTQAEQEGQDLAGSLSSIDQDLSNLGRERMRYGEQVVKDVKDLGAGYETGTVRRGSFFGQLSPNAYQSSQGSSQQYAKGKLDEGISAIGQAKGDTEEAYRQREASIGQERNALQTQYERANAARAREVENAARSAETYVNQFNDSIAEGLAPLDISQNLAANRYSRSSYDPVAQSRADTSAITPYTTFGQIGALPQASGLQSYRPSFQQSTGGDNFASFLGYEPTNDEADFLRRYLSSGVTA